MRKELPARSYPNLCFNHQSTYDIPALIWHLRRHSPRFIAKKELGKGLPSISFHLREGGNVLIDRKDPTGSLEAIAKFAQRVYQKGGRLLFFLKVPAPEMGNLKIPTRCLTTLLQHLPDALLVPLAFHIHGNSPNGIISPCP